MIGAASRSPRYLLTCSWVVIASASALSSAQASASAIGPSTNQQDKHVDLQGSQCISRMRLANRPPYPDLPHSCGLGTESRDVQQGGCSGVVSLAFFGPPLCPVLRLIASFVADAGARHGGLQVFRHPVGPSRAAGLWWLIGGTCTYTVLPDLASNVGHHQLTYCFCWCSRCQSRVSYMSQLSIALHHS